MFSWPVQFTIMPTNTTTSDPRARRWGIAVKGLAILGVGFFVAPYIWVAIGGLAGLAVAGMLMLSSWMLLPWLGLKAGNLRLMLVKEEAARNPVPTLQQELQRQQQGLDERKTAIGHFKGQVVTFEDKLEVLGEKYGRKDPSYVKMATQLDIVRKVLQNREEKWQALYVQTGRFGQEIEKAAMVWDVAQAAAAAQTSSGLTEKDFMAQLQRDTALDSIRSSFNDMAASLDTDLMQNDAEKMLSAPAVQEALPAPDDSRTITIDVDSAPEVTKAPVKRRSL
jgi:hypothetical protein